MTVVLCPCFIFTSSRLADSLTASDLQKAQTYKGGTFWVFFLHEVIIAHFSTSCAQHAAQMWSCMHNSHFHTLKLHLFLAVSARAARANYKKENV